jgi:hypothetical protein
MSLNAYTDDARTDITDAEHLRALFDEVETVLADIIRRLEQLET